MKKIALCFIISYEHVLNKEQIWIDWIEPNKDIINVYFHYKNINLIKSNWIRKHTIPPKLTHTTSYFNVVPAYMSVLSFAFHHDTDNLWFCLLTDSCVPIISPKKFRQLFFEHFQASLIKCKPAYWNINIHRRANLWLFKKEYWLFNDPWFTLCRAHVQKCMIFLVGKQGIYQKVNNGGLANESMFAIILQTFKLLYDTQSHINESTTVADWSRMTSPTSPYLFKDGTDTDLINIKSLLKENKYAIFLRKVHKDFPDKHIYDIMETDFEHKYDKKYNFAYTNRNIFINLILYTFLFAYGAFLLINILI
jgi:hypothetical protein